VNQLGDSLQLTLDQPHLVSRWPRAWCLFIGLCCIPTAFSLLLVEPAGAYWNSKHLGDADFAALLVLMVGSFFLAKALVSDLLKVCAVTLTPNGISLMWSHVPQIFGGGVSKKIHLLWPDVDTLVWIEGESELDMKQYLQIEFKERIAIRKTVLKVLVSDDQNEMECKKVIDLLPPSLVKPEWLQSISQPKSLASKGDTCH
jgi:hypothetical protein